MTISMASCRNQGFRRQSAAGVKIPRKPGPRSKDYSALLAMARDGKTFAEIGKSAGISRERVRQIAAREGVVSFRSHVNDAARRDQFAAAVRGGADPKEAGRSLGYAESSALTLTSRLGLGGIRLRRKREAFDLESAAALEAIRNGASIRSQSRDTAHARRLQALCKRLGVISKSRTGGGKGRAARIARLAAYEARQ